MILLNWPYDKKKQIHKILALMSSSNPFFTSSMLSHCHKIKISNSCKEPVIIFFSLEIFILIKYKDIW